MASLSWAQLAKQGKSGPSPTEPLSPKQDAHSPLEPAPDAPDAPADMLSPDADPQPAPAPKVNVWAVRKEKMAESIRNKTASSSAATSPTMPSPASLNGHDAPVPSVPSPASRSDAQSRGRQPVPQPKDKPRPSSHASLASATEPVDLDLNDGASWPTMEEGTAPLPKPHKSPKPALDAPEEEPEKPAQPEKRKAKWTPIAVDIKVNGSHREAHQRSGPRPPRQSMSGEGKRLPPSSSASTTSASDLPQKSDSRLSQSTSVRTKKPNSHPSSHQNSKRTSPDTRSPALPPTETMPNPSSSRQRASVPDIAPTLSTADAQAAPPTNGDLPNLALSTSAQNHSLYQSQSAGGSMRGPPRRGGYSNRGRGGFNPDRSFRGTNNNPPSFPPNSRASYSQPSAALSPATGSRSMKTSFSSPPVGNMGLPYPAYNQFGYDQSGYYYPQYGMYPQMGPTPYATAAPAGVPFDPLTGEMMRPAPMLSYDFPFHLEPMSFWVLGQIEFYLSVDNLCRDMYLRKNMDDQGWTDVTLIANFNRMKQLTTDVTIVRKMLKVSAFTEVKGNKFRLKHWQQWILPDAQPHEPFPDNTVTSPITFTAPELPTPTATVSKLPTTNGSNAYTETQQTPGTPSHHERYDSADPSSSTTSSDGLRSSATTSATTMSPSMTTAPSENGENEKHDVPASPTPAGTAQPKIAA